MSRRENRSDFAEHPSCPKARAEIADRREDLIDRLISWANQNSGSHNQPGLEAIAQLVAKTISPEIESEPTFIRCPETEELLAIRWKKEIPDTPKVLLNGHLDTVYSPESEFLHCTASSDRKTVQGPGVTDMKGGVVILFAALHAFLNSELSQSLSWEVLLTFDEEIGSEKSRSILEEAAKRKDIGIVFESSLPDGSLIRNRMGTGLITATTTGRAAHSGRDFSKGKNAIVALASFLTSVHALNRSIEGAIINVGNIEGGGAVNVVPDHARAEINLRARDRAAEQAILSELKEHAERTKEETGCDIQLIGGFTRPPKTADASTNRLMQAWQHTASAFDQTLHWKDTGGASDGNILQAAGLPNIDNLGACGNHIHSANEYIETDSLVHRSQLVASFLINLADGRLDLPTATNSDSPKR